MRDIDPCLVGASHPVLVCATAATAQGLGVSVLDALFSLILNRARVR